MNSSQSYERRWWTLAALCLSLLMVTIDNLIVNVALPTLGVELRTSASQLQWIVEAYSLVFAGLLLVGGTLSDRWGSRRILTLGLVVFGVASTVGAFVSSASALIIARAVMGLGGAMIMPSTLAMIKHIFPAHERARAIGIWSATASVGVAGGPLLGGWLLEYFWWGAIFLVNVPIVVVAIVSSLRLLPMTPTRKVPLDLVGAALSFVGIASLVYAIIEASHWGWTSIVTRSVVVVALASLALFVWWERRIEHPMLRISLFGNRTFSAAIGINLLTYLALGGFSFILPQYLQSVQGYGPLQAGLRTLPLAAAIAVASVAAAWLTRRIGTKMTVAGGLVLIVGALGVLSALTVASSYTLLVGAMLLLGIGAGTAYTAGTDAVIGVVPSEQAGAASATNEMSLELGTALGIAILGSVLLSGYRTAMLAGTTLPETLRAMAAESIGVAVEVAGEQGGDLGIALLDYARAAFMNATQTTTFWGMGLALFGVALALAFLPGRSMSQGVPASHHA